jgi:hypothetical protein
MSKEKMKNEIQAVCDQATNTNIVPYIFSLDKIESPNCKLCQSDLREKAEELYDNQKRKNYAAIQRVLKDQDDFEINVFPGLVLDYPYQQCAECKFATSSCLFLPS